MIDNVKHFEDLSSYFENYFPNVDPHVVGNPVFTNNGTADLERKGLSGYSVWVGYHHKGSGASSKVFEKKMKAFVYAEVIPAFEEFIAESGETFENPEVIVEDFTATTDMVRLYAVTSSNKGVKNMEKKPISFKVIKDSLKKRFNILFPENIRIVRRFTEYEKDYTEFLYDTFACSVSRHLPKEEYVTCRVILEDCWVVSKE